ncbi:SOS response-associated peptidase [Mesorhizobium xinjiangense]|uniref:SOS response-associated peptidase n=1 Tax=Mesorhizobium xinjiangense TaxID=2678685 RepID=UPI0012EE11C3|nr:SOS response-associated peptidase [Mesorhizobium xinjiangense]
MCNLYHHRAGPQMILDFTRAMTNRAGNLAPGDVYPNTFGPIVRKGEDGKRELVAARWGMPSPHFALKGKNYDYGVTNIRNTTSPHWRRWLGVENRCLVPVTRFAEPDPASKVEGGRTPIAWFALNEDEPLFLFAGLWTPWTGKRKAKEDPADHELYGFLTTEPNGIVGPVHKKAMPVMLTEPDEIELWMTAPWEEAKQLQRPLPDERMVRLEQITA